MQQHKKSPCTTGWSGDSSFLHKRNCSRLVNALFALGSRGRITSCLGCGTAEPSAQWATAAATLTPRRWSLCGLSELRGCGRTGRAAGGRDCGHRDPHGSDRQDGCPRGGLPAAGRPHFPPGSGPARWAAGGAEGGGRAGSGGGRCTGTHLPACD